MSRIIRPPVVTILGHVDHGKTTLLDHIRKSDVAAKEHGGITQAIGAYQITHEGRSITFIDTPGHAAFEKMRYRGAALADIAILVVAVDDGVMPQTVEAIKHIQTSQVAMMVAVNKIDIPGINLPLQLEKIKKQLSGQKVLIEEYGGDVPLVKVSAKTGAGVDDLLETISLLSQMHEFQGDPEAPLNAVVVESHLDKFKGPIATVLVRDGSLKKGGPLSGKGKVRGMFDYSGKAVSLAGPSTPVEVLGFETVPAVGSVLGQAEDVRVNADKGFSLLDKLTSTGIGVLNVVIKADQAGSLEAIETALDKFNDGVQHLKVISSGTGEITESDVGLAQTTKAIVLGFNVAVRPTASKLAETSHTLIRRYNIIYELIEEMEEVVEGMLKPHEMEEVFGRAQIVAEFPYGKGERIAGCRVVEGNISKAPRIRIVREDGEKVGEGRVKSIKRNKEEVSKVEAGQDCGMMFDSAINFSIGDIIESYRTL